MRPGDVIAERFEILQGAGAGGMGIVYQAHDRSTQQVVALKVLIERKEGLTDRFAQEVEILAALEHPHIIGYVTHGFTTAGAPYLVMPWLDGHDLQARIDSGPLSVEETLSVARSVADALAYLHSSGIVHRDLKPTNLFLPGGKLEQVKVIDLGIARATIPTRPMTLTGTLLGTPGFIAPEQALGDSEVSPAVDVFALGCVLFECLTGKRLFDGAHVMAVLAKILVEEPPRVGELRPDVPDELDELIHRMVAKDPERRPRDGAELVLRLEDLRRTPRRSSQVPAPPSLTDGERRVVSVLAVVLPAPETPVDPEAVVARSELDPFRASSARFGVRILPLDTRTAIVLAPKGFGAADQASVLARFGRFVTETFPGASVTLATGSAVTGNRLPVGEAIDRGVTMVRAAKPGQGVHVDDLSAALITSRFDLRREGGRVLLADERRSLDPSRPLLGRPTSCVGRERELAILDGAFAECLDGAGPKLILVTATAGAGKSRLRHELVRRLRASSVPPPNVLKCRGDPFHLATPYAQIAQTMRHAADTHEREAPASVREKLLVLVKGLVSEGEVLRIADFLGELVGAPFEDDGRLALRAARRSAEAMADQIRLAFADVLRAWAKKHPLVLILEDLHWGDAASVKLVDGVLRKLDGVPLLVLALARPEVHERFPALWSKRHVTEVCLPPLQPRDATKLVHEVMSDVLAEDVQRIVERSEGNAFYLEELIRKAAEPSSSRRDDLPETVIAVAQARLERLEPNLRKVLRAASIYGEVFSIEGVSALVGEEASALISPIRALIEHEAIAPSEQPRLAGVQELVFRHVLLRGAVYATLTEDDRVLGHRLAATWLEGHDDDPETVALHWLEAGERKRAAACFAEAAETRWARSQAEAATRCAVRSLLVADAGTEGIEVVSGRLRLLANSLNAARWIDANDVMAGLEHHVSVPLAAGDAIDGRTLVHIALDRSFRSLGASEDACGSSSCFAHAACALGAISDFKGAKRLLAEATTRAADDQLRLRDVHYASARVSFWAGEWGAVVDSLSDTLLPSNQRERVEMLLILASAVVAVDGPDALGRGLDCVSRAEELVFASGEDPVARVHCCKARLFCFALAGERAKAAETAEAAVALSRQVGLRYEECAHLQNVGEEYLRLGERERARAALLESLELAHDLGAERTQLHDEALLAFLDARASRIEEIAEGFRTVNNTWYELQTRYWLGLLLASQKAPHARRELGRALDLARELKVRSMAEECAEAIAGLAPNA